MDLSAKVIVMVGPSLESRGGIASVVCAYRAAGMFDDWPVLYINSHVEGTKWLKLLTAAKGLFKLFWLLLLGRVGVLHIHVARAISFWRKSIFIYLAYLFRCSVFVHLHSGGFPDFYWESCGSVKKKIVKNILNRATVIIVLSNHWWSILEGITCNKRIVRITNFIALEQVSPVTEQRQQNTVLFLGRLSDEKGFFDLLESVVWVRDIFPDYKLLCGGEGNYDYVNSYIQRLGIEHNVKLLGWVNDKMRQELLDTAAIFVLPSYVEGMPMAVIEAMSRGVPVIASSVGGIPDAVTDGKEGLLINAGDITGLAMALINLLGNPVKRLEMGAAGKIKVQKEFIASTVLPDLYKLYQEAGIVKRSAEFD